MLAIRAVLGVLWLTLIATLFFDPLSVRWTHPDSLGSPFRLHPEICVWVQGQCLEQAPYAMGARIFWAMIVPLGVFVLLTFGHELWRRVCPLSFFSQIPRLLGRQRRRLVVLGGARREVPRIARDSWLGRNHLYLQFGLLSAGLCARILFINSDRTALGLFLLATIALSILVGYLYAGKSWCHYFCPMAPVQMFFGGPRSLLGTDATAHRGAPTQSMCRTARAGGPDRSACVNCASPCFDIDAERSYWERLTAADQRLIFYGYPGLVVAFYVYYYLYSGGWSYYFSGAWTHEERQLSLVLAPGLYLAGRAVPLPRLLAVPLTIAAFAALSYLLWRGAERAYGWLRRRRGRPLPEEALVHRVYALSTFVTFNFFFLFGGRPNLRLLPAPLLWLVNTAIVVVSTLWLARTFPRTRELYSREGLVGSLRRQLRKVADRLAAAGVLQGRSIEQLGADEVYVLAKVLPASEPGERLRVYRGVLQDTLAAGPLSATEADVLRSMRQQLGVTDEEHFVALAELGHDPAEALAAPPREDLLRVEGYRSAIEVLLLGLLESGTPLSAALERRRPEITELRERHGITDEEHAQVMAELFERDGVLLRKGAHLLAQIQALAVRARALRRPARGELDVPCRLLRQTVLQRQEALAAQVLSVLELLGDSAEAARIARTLALLAEGTLPRLLSARDAARGRWEERLPPATMAALRDQGGVGAGAGAALAESALTPPPGALEHHLATGEGLLAILAEMLHDVDPLNQALSLHALQIADPGKARAAAERLRREQRPEDLDPLLREVMERALGQREDARTVERLLMLSRCPLFSQPEPVSKDALLTLARAAHLRTYRAGDALLRAGEPVRDLHVLVQGGAQVRVSGDASGRTVELIGAGQLLSESALLVGAPCAATVVATRDTQVLCIAAADFNEALRADLRLMRNTLILISGRLENTLAAQGGGGR